MPHDIQGKELLSWEIAEYHEHSRGFWWYTVAIVIGVILLVYALVQRNFLFAFIIIMFGVIIVTHTLRPLAHYTFSITDLGIKLGERFFPWKDLEQFWIAYEPPEIKTLYFEFGGLRPRLPIPLEDTDPNKVRKVLRKMLNEDLEHTEEPLSDWAARVLKI